MEETQCKECRSPLRLGDCLWNAEQGVIGPRGIVPLGEALNFCCEKCLADYFAEDGVEDAGELPHRVP